MELSEDLTGHLAAEAARIVQEAEADGLVVRVLGGLAVHLHAPQVPTALQRTYGDIDVAAPGGARRELEKLFKRLAYESNDRFNSMNSRRMMFGEPVHRIRVDVFLGEFAMCHRLTFAHRLEADPLSLPLAELLLTKTQVVQLTRKDMSDIYAILLAHDVGDHDIETVNADQVAELCAGDWGLWRTTTLNLAACSSSLEQFELAEEERHLLQHRIRLVEDAIAARPKSRRWRSRNRLGDRFKWYDEPEEIDHAD